MAFIRRKGRSFYLVHNVREGRKVKQLYLARLGSRPRINDDVIRGVEKKHPLLRIPWRNLQEQVSRDLIHVFQNDSQYLRSFLENLRSVNFDLADLSPPMLELGADRQTAMELMTMLKLLRTTLDIKLNQLRRARHLNLLGRRS